MRAFFRLILALAFGLALLALLTGGALWHLVSDAPGLHLSINGEELNFQGLDSVGDMAGGLIACLVGGVILCIALPLLLLLGLGLPLLILGLVFGGLLLGALSLGGLLFSPAFLMILLLYLLLRSPKKNSTPSPQKP